MAPEIAGSMLTPETYEVNMFSNRGNNVLSVFELRLLSTHQNGLYVISDSICSHGAQQDASSSLFFTFF